MALLDKLAFWRKKDEFDLGDLGPMPGEKQMPGMDTSAFEKELSSEPGGFPGEEPSAFPRTTPSDIPEEPAGPAFGAPPGPLTRQSAPQRPMQMYGQNRDIELLSAKLDAIRAMLENINQRLEKIERLARSSEHEIY